MCMIVCNRFLQNYLFQFASLKSAEAKQIKISDVRLYEIEHILNSIGVKTLKRTNLRIAKTKTKKFKNIQICIYCQYYWP